MRTILDIARNDLVIIFKDRSIWLNLIVIPLVIAYVIGFATGGGAASSGSRAETASAPRLIVDVMNADGGELATAFMDDLRGVNANLVLCPEDNNDADVCQLGDATFDAAVAQARLEQERSLALIEIPAGFTETINAGENVRIVYRSNEDATAPSYILQAVQAVMQRMGGALVAARVGAGVAQTLNVDDPAFAEAVRENASALWQQDPVRIEHTVAQIAESETTNVGGFSQSFPGIATMYVMFSVFPAATVLIQERKNWTLQRLAVMPISRTQILSGKLLARFAVGMLQFVIMFGFGALLGVRYGSDPVALVLIMAAFTLCITALTLALTTVLTTVSQATGVTLFLTLTLAPLGGAWWSLEIVPAWMRTVGHISPVAWAMDGFRSLMFESGSLATVALPIVVLLGMTAVFFAIGVARFRFTE